MPDQFKEFITVLDAFDKQRVDYVLIGGVALVLHGMGRLTRDVDIFVRMVPENIDRLRMALDSVFHDPSIEEITLTELQKYAVVRYGTPSGFYIDIMARLGVTASFDSLKYENLDYQGTTIKLATAEILYSLKKDSLRDQDKIDAMFLKDLLKARGSKPVSE